MHRTLRTLRTPPTRRPPTERIVVETSSVQQPSELPTNDAVLSLVIDSRIYDVSVVQATAHRLTTAYSFNFHLNEHNLTVSANPKPGFSVTEANFRASFLNELLDQQLRKIVALETKAERDLILAYAFSNTKLADST